MQVEKEPFMQASGFSNHSTKYIRRLPKSNNLQEALEEYQQETGNCIVNDYNKETK